MERKKNEDERVIMQDSTYVRIIRIGVTEKTFKEKSKEESCRYVEKETSGAKESVNAKDPRRESAWQV